MSGAIWRDRRAERVSNELLRVENLIKTYPARTSKGQPVRAVDDVSFSIEKGKTLGLVGESGSGKTTTGRAVLRLTEPDSGSIFFEGKDITKGNMRPYRRKMQIVFQSPAGSLDPSFPVWKIISEGPKAYKLLKTKREAVELSRELLLRVGLNSEDAFRYPGEFSGGQQQRIGIARALAMEPEFVVCDEPVSALDVSYQAQIVNMLIDLRQERELSYLFISHDLSVVMHLSDEIGVMYQGQLMELGSCEEIAKHPAHPYTRELLRAVPVADPRKAASRESRIIAFPEGSVNRGCPYRLRCPVAGEECGGERPSFRDLGGGHFSACIKE